MNEPRFGEIYKCGDLELFIVHLIEKIRSCESLTFSVGRGVKEVTPKENSVYKEWEPSGALEIKITLFGVDSNPPQEKAK